MQLYIRNKTKFLLGANFIFSHKFCSGRRAVAWLHQAAPRLDRSQIAAYSSARILQSLTKI